MVFKVLETTWATGLSMMFSILLESRNMNSAIICFLLHVVEQLNEFESFFFSFLKCRIPCKGYIMPIKYHFWMHFFLWILIFQILYFQNMHILTIYMWGKITFISHCGWILILKASDLFSWKYSHIMFVCNKNSKYGICTLSMSAASRLFAYNNV